MQRIASRLETVANVAVIVAAMFVVAVAASRLWPHSHAAPVTYAPGEVMDVVPGVDYRASERTALVFVRSTCRFCTESMPFYEKMVAQTKGSQQARVVAMSDEEIAVTRSYFARHNVPVQDVIKADAQRFRVAGTPTIIVVDRTGSVRGAWVGVLSNSAQGEVLKLLAPRS